MDKTACDAALERASASFDDKIRDIRLSLVKTPLSIFVRQQINKKRYTEMFFLGMLSNPSVITYASILKLRITLYISRLPDPGLYFIYIKWETPRICMLTRGF